MGWLPALWLRTSGKPGGGTVLNPWAPPLPVSYTIEIAITPVVPGAPATPGEPAIGIPLFPQAASKPVLLELLARPAGGWPRLVAPVAARTSGPPAYVLKKAGAVVPNTVGTATATAGVPFAVRPSSTDGSPNEFNRAPTLGITPVRSWAEGISAVLE